MNAQIVETSASISTPSDVELQVLTALHGKQSVLKFQGKPALTDKECEDFKQKVKLSILATRATDLQIQERLDREYNIYLDRRDTVLENAKALGVKFFHRREKIIEDEVLSAHIINRNTLQKVVEGKIVKSPFGGQTFAFIYKLDDENNLAMLYSVAFCREDEQFDEVIGMEESLKKFIRGDVVEMELSHDRLGDPKLIQMSNNFRRLTSKK